MLQHIHESIYLTSKEFNYYKRNSNISSVAYGIHNVNMNECHLVSQHVYKTDGSISMYTFSCNLCPPNNELLELA